MQYLQYPGESVRWKTLRRNWLGGQSKPFCLIGMTDEATGRTLARFTPNDSLRENLRTLSMYVTRCGRPRQVCTDRSALFVGASANSKQVRNGQCQIRRALSELGIRWAGSHSPGDLGGRESFFSEVRRNLSSELESAGAATVEDAAAYLDNIFLPRWNSAIAFPKDSDFHTPLLPEHDLESILGTVQLRTVSPQGTIHFDHQLYRLSGLPALAAIQGEDVRVEVRDDGRILARWNGKCLDLEPITSDFEAPQAKPLLTPRKPRRANRGWMKGFFDRPTGPIWQHYK